MLMTKRWNALLVSQRKRTRTEQTKPGSPKNIIKNDRISQLYQCWLQLPTLTLCSVSDPSGSRGGWSRVEAQSRLPDAPHHPPLCLLRPQEDQDVSCIKGLFFGQQKLLSLLSRSSLLAVLLQSSVQECHTSVWNHIYSAALPCDFYLVLFKTLWPLDTSSRPPVILYNKLTHL